MTCVFELATSDGNAERLVTVAATEDPVPDKESAPPNKLRSK